MGESGLLRAEVVGMAVHDEAVARREAYLVSWSDVSGRGGAGFAMLSGRRRGVVMRPDGSALFTVAVSGTEDLEGCRDCIADPFASFPSNIGDCVGPGTAMLETGGVCQYTEATGSN